MLTEQDCNIADKGDEADYTSNNVLLAIEEGLSCSVKFGVVCDVVVALGQETERSFTTVMSALISL